MVGIDVYDIENDIEKTITRLTARVALADKALGILVETQLEEGKNIARKNIQEYVYARPQGPNTRYKRTYDLLNAVKSGTVKSKGAIAAGQVFISRDRFHRVYYPVYVEYGHEAGAPYEGRGYWAVTIAELRASTARKTVVAGRIVAKGIGI